MRVVFDVSTSLNWNRPAVGIVRAEQRFAAFLLDQTEIAAAFCRYDRDHQGYDEVPRARVRELVEGAPADAAPPPVKEERPAASSPNGFAMRGRRSASSLARRWVTALPAAVQEEADLVARNGTLMIKSLYWLSRKIVRELGSRAEPAYVGDSPVPADEEAADRPDGFRFDPDDVYVSMGLDWDHNDLPTLYRVKRKAGFKAILYCHDIIPIRFPHLMSFDARGSFARHFVDVAHTADHVVAVSRASLDDFRGFLLEVGAPVPPVSVVHNGSDLAACGGAAGEPPRSDLAERPFVLCVGTIEPRKNHALLYHVWDRLVERHGERAPVLVLVGMAGWGVTDVLSRMRGNPRVADHIVLFNELSDEGLMWLYRHCLFTVYPSFVEGWGLPVVESMALGKPCIASNAASIAEASQGLLPLLDPLDFPGWLAQVERWAFDRQALAAATKALEGFRPHSWRDHGEALLALVRETAGSRACASYI